MAKFWQICATQPCEQPKKSRSVIGIMGIQVLRRSLMLLPGYSTAISIKPSPLTGEHLK